MTMAEWQASTDIPVMIGWLEQQGYEAMLWEFTVAFCRRVRDDLPGDAFRRVLSHAELIGAHGIDDVLAEASQALDRLERRFRKAEVTEQARLNRQIGLGRMVFAFDYQDGASAATSISGDLLEWADDAAEERRTQAVLLRDLVPDPSQPAVDEDDEA